jgi:predicted choloylglycine hydrolase
MLTIPVHTIELKGTNFEIGYKLGRIISENTAHKLAYIRTLEGFGQSQYKDAVKLFDEWCPGISEEIAGFADALNVNAEQIAYYAMTYLIPRCSQIAVLPGLTAQNKPLLARNYEFNHQMEDFVLARTSVTGKYTHMGTSTMSFGRDDGFNEHGLAVTMSACGFPVGAAPFLRAPKIKGLHFWAAIRAILENCKNVEEALHYLKEMPIASNINLMLLDKSGNAALFETMDGNQETKQISPASQEQFLWATNHPVLPSLIQYEPEAAIHSLRRGEWIASRLEGASEITNEQLKKMLLSNYPDGLCCHYFQDYFGTTKSMLFSPADGIMELCWGGRAENGWQTYDIKQVMPDSSTTIQICMENADKTMFGYQSLRNS